MKLYCPSCALAINAGTNLIGQKGRCPDCGEKFTISEELTSRPVPTNDARRIMAQERQSNHKAHGSPRKPGSQPPGQSREKGSKNLSTPTPAVQKGKVVERRPLTELEKADRPGGWATVFYWILFIIAFSTLTLPHIHFSREEGLLAFLGRFHIFLLHLPLTLIFLVPIMEIYGRITKKTNVRLAASFVLTLALIASIAACLSGVLYYKADPASSTSALLDKHMWWGIGVALGCAICLILKVGMRRRPGEGLGWVYSFFLLPTLIGVLITNQLGANSRYGDDFLVEHMPSSIQDSLGLEPGAAPANGGDSVTIPVFADLSDAADAVADTGKNAFDPAKADLFANYVQPILNQHCTSCHGEKKNKGKIRLHTYTDIMAGAKGEPIVEAGKPDDSALYYRTQLEDDDEERMPPADDGKERLPDAKAAVLKWWIELGAKETVPVSSLQVSEDMKKVLATLKPVDTAALAAAAKAKTALAAKQAGTLAGISKKLGILALPTYQGSTDVDINALNVADKFGDEQLKELAPLKDAVVNLNLARSQVTDGGLATVGTMSNLKVLHLEKTKITGSGLAQLAGLKKLEYLNLYGTAVDDASIEKLAGVKSLKRLYLFESKATKAGADKLKAQIPGLEVNLGVSLAPPPPKKEEPKKEEPKKAAEAPAKPDPVKAQFVKLAKLFDDGSCCHKAHAAKGVCKHGCCIKAAKANQVCLKCNPGAKDKKP